MKMRQYLTLLILSIFSIGSINAQQLTNKEQIEILTEAYEFSYPLMMMKYTKLALTNVEIPENGMAPTNQFGFRASFPDHTFTDIVRPNLDTYYSTMFVDVSVEPIVVQLPKTKYYHLFPILNAFTDVIGSPGTRTNGGEEPYTFVIVGPEYDGLLPEGMDVFYTTTNMNWILGRVEVSNEKEGKKIYKQFQAKIQTRPLSEWYNNRYIPNLNIVYPSRNIVPVATVDSLDIDQYFNEVAQLMEGNPPYKEDSVIVAKMAQMGIVAGETFRFGDLPEEVKEAAALIPAKYQEAWTLMATKGDSTEHVNNWTYRTEGLGEYKSDYRLRAYVAAVGLGANTSEDAIYANTGIDMDGKALNSDEEYIIHFERGQTPPVNGFWSLTLYDQNNFLAENPKKKYAIKMNDALKYNEDGSLDIFISTVPPENKEQFNNWLPCPITGENFSLTLRMYWPQEEVLNKTWKTPEVKKVKQSI